jgi:4-hydroxybenzoate polyprenyltransferase
VTSPSVVSQVRSFATLVRLSHTVFALPFALVSLLVATEGSPPGRVLLLVVLAVVAARTAAMAYNRYRDRDIDAANPRTANREIPRGVVTPAAALGLTIVASGCFCVCSGLLGPACGWLAPIALLWLLGYSHAKRFSSLCHLWLGVALGLAPLAAWLAADGEWSQRLLAPAVLGVAVALWVAGFDVLYACQDEAFDRAFGLHSLPARLGAARAMWISRGCHLVAAVGFAVFGCLASLGVGWYCGVVVAAALLVVQHRLLRPTDLARIQAAFFTANGAIAVLLLVAAMGDLYLLR